MYDSKLTYANPLLDALVKLLSLTMRDHDYADYEPQSDCVAVPVVSHLSMPLCYCPPSLPFETVMMCVIGRGWKAPDAAWRKMLLMQPPQEELRLETSLVDICGEVELESVKLTRQNSQGYARAEDIVEAVREAAAIRHIACYDLLAYLSGYEFWKTLKDHSQLMALK